jgi:vacuolar-type H+-ATPase subunit C/Vma6
MRKPSRLNYAYAVGRVRALEDKLISKPVFTEAAEEEGIPSALKVIFDEGMFREQKVEIQNSEQLDEFLLDEEMDLESLTSELLLEREIGQILAGEYRPGEVLSVAEGLDYPFITDYLRQRVDLGNLKILCRAKYLELPPQRFEGLLMKGGFLDLDFFLESFGLSFAEIGDKLRASAYQPIWVRATDELVDRETFVVLEREIENFLMQYLKKAKYIVFGPEPVFAYILARKKELRLIRFLGVGKLNQIAVATIKERLSDTYV